MIALSEQYSEEYLLSPTAEEYARLCELKSDYSKKYKIMMDVNRIDLESEIRTLLIALINISADTQLVPLTYDALRIDEKFTNENFIIKNDVLTKVLSYYRYIESVLSESDADFDVIASEVKVCSQKLEKSGMSQENVINHLAEWIRNKTNLGPNSKMACNIIVAFFIQNCEVFYK